MDTNPPIELSDDENDGSKMPPPAFVPPAKAVKEKKPPAEKQTRVTRSKQSKRTKVCVLIKMPLLTIGKANTIFGVLSRSNKNRHQRVKMILRPQAQAR